MANYTKDEQKHIAERFADALVNYPERAEQMKASVAAYSDAAGNDPTATFQFMERVTELAHKHEAIPMPASTQDASPGM